MSHSYLGFTPIDQHFCVALVSIRSGPHKGQNRFCCRRFGNPSCLAMDHWTSTISSGAPVQMCYAPYRDANYKACGLISCTDPTHQAISDERRDIFIFSKQFFKVQYADIIELKHETGQKRPASDSIEEPPAKRPRLDNIEPAPVPTLAHKEVIPEPIQLESSDSNYDSDEESSEPSTPSISQ